MIANIDDIKKYIFVNNNIPINNDITDIEFTNLKIDCAKSMIVFVKSYKKTNIINQFINHIEQQINVNHVNDINNLMTNFNIIHNTPINTGLLPPIAPSSTPLTPLAPSINKIYFPNSIYNTILNTYASVNDSWICPYEYMDIASNLYNIKNLFVLEISNLHVLATNLNDLLSKYQKNNDYRNIINTIIVNM